MGSVRVGAARLRLAVTLTWRVPHAVPRRLTNTLQGFHAPGRADVLDPRWEPRTGLKHIVREKEKEVTPLMKGVVRPRPAAPLGQAAYWERYSLASEQKRQQETDLLQVGAAWLFTAVVPLPSALCMLSNVT